MEPIGSIVELPYALEHALMATFRHVLDELGVHQPVLDAISYHTIERTNEIRIKCEFMDVQRRRHEYGYAISQSELFRDPRPAPTTRNLRVSAHRLWSRVFEDHYMGQIEQAARVRAHSDYERTGDRSASFRATEETRRLREHVNRYHTIPTDYLQSPPPAQEMTATEVMMRQREYEDTAIAATSRLAADMQRRINESMIEAMYGGMSATRVSADEAGSLTLESITNAMQALANNDRNYRWRDMFQRDPMADWMYFAPEMEGYGLDVGTKEAQEKGRKILLENLTARQRIDYEKHKHFDVVGGESGKTYRIKHGRQMNIAELDKKGKRVCGWCFLPQGGLVAGDVMLAQKVALELYEGEALTIANRFPEHSDNGGAPWAHTLRCWLAQRCISRSRGSANDLVTIYPAGPL